jgi:hypothetical protein
MILSVDSLLIDGVQLPPCKMQGFCFLYDLPPVLCIVPRYTDLPGGEQTPRGLFMAADRLFGGSGIQAAPVMQVCREVESRENGEKNDLAVSTLTVPAGAYLIGSSVKDGGNYIYKMIVDVEVPHEHVWSDATCEEPAKCECGETQGEALDHAYEAGTCTRCGAEDPNYVEPQPPVEDPKDPGEPPVEMNFFQKIIAWFTALIEKILAIFKK